MMRASCFSKETNRDTHSISVIKSGPLLQYSGISPDQAVNHLTRQTGVLDSTPGHATIFILPFTFNILGIGDWGRGLNLLKHLFPTKFLGLYLTIT